MWSFLMIALGSVIGWFAHELIRNEIMAIVTKVKAKFTK